MPLPNQTELLKTFSSFLIESGLSAVSIKNYLCDLRHFLTFCNPIQSAHTDNSTPTSPTDTNVEEIFRNISKYINLYTENQVSVFTPQSTINRRLASIRRFTTFLNAKYGIPNLLSVSDKNSPITQTDQNVSPSFSSPDQNKVSNTTLVSSLTTEKIIDQFKSSLSKEKKTHSTIKNYVSDLNHFFQWTANQTPYTIHNLVNILSESQLNAYITYLKLSHTSVSVINRRQSSIKKLAKFCAQEKYIPENPFEIKQVSQSLAPLSWIERLSHKPKKAPSAPKNRFAVLYSKYNALPFTPYLHIAILVLATTAMAIFGYNQIISQARPSAAATALTPPKRQLSFQGRLTDSSATPITTAVNIVFKLWNAATGPAQLYSSGTCSITPDQDGVFNTLIGNGVCGAEIPSSVFTDNRDVFLELTVGSETLTPRQQIATVGYALNSETLQGYPASASATANTVPVMDGNGNIVLAQTNPSIIATSSSGIFTVKGDSLSLQTNINSGGDIILQPDALGQGQILGLGGTTADDTFRITNANLTTGALISGYVGNNGPNSKLISLSSGASESAKFWVMADGRTSINSTATGSALIVNQNGTGDLFTASTSGTTKFRITNTGNVDITGQYLSNGLPINLWQRTSGSIAPLYITDSLNLGATATTSAIVHLAGTANENSFINTGYLGIGTTSPNQLVDIFGSVGRLAVHSTNASQNSAFLLYAKGATTGENAGGLYYVGNDTATNRFFAISGDNNNYHLSINYSGNVGIGTTTPTATLDVVGDASTSGSLVLRGSTPATIDVMNGSRLAFQTSNGGDAGLSERMTLINNGNLGIGTTTPAYKLDVVGDINLTGAIRLNGSAGTAGYVLTSSGGGLNTWTPTSGINFWQRNSGTLSPANIWESLNLGSTATTSATVHLAGVSGENSFINTGNVGIGTTAPNYPLHIVNNSSNGIVAMVKQNNTASYSQVRIDADTALSGLAAFGSTYSANGVYTPNSVGFQSIAQNGFNIVNEHASGFISFVTGGFTTNDERMRITSTGLVGIGTTTPLAQLDVRAGSGTIPVASISGATAMAAMIVDNSGSGDLFTASTSGQTRLVIDKNGKLGIGLTNPAYTLDLNGNFNIASGGIRAGGSFGSPGQVLSSTGTGVQWIAAATGGGNSSPWNWNTGVIYPFSITDAVNLGSSATASATVHLAGTAGDNSFINTGFFGVGLTNPAYKLDVNGDINLSGGIRASGSFGSPGQVLSSTGTGVQWTTVSSGSGSNWTIANGAIYPNNATLDVLFGGNATSSAKFAFTGVSAGTPTASISGSTTNVATYLTGDGNLATTNMQPLTIGSPTTGSVQLTPNGTTGLTIDNNGEVGIGTTTPSYNLDISGTTRISSTVNLPALTADRLVVTDTSGNLTSSITSANLALSITNETGTGVAVFNTSPTFATQITTPIVKGGTAVSSNLILKSTSGVGTTDYISFQVGNNGATEAARIVNSGAIGMGTTTPLAKLDVRAITTNNTPIASFSGATKVAGVVIDQSGTGDIFTASTSGQTRYTLKNNGDILATGAISGLTGITSSGPITLTSLGTGIVHASASGLLTSSAVNLSTDISGVLPILNGGTNNTSYTSGKFLAYDGTKLASTIYDQTSFEVPLTFSNGLTRSSNIVKWGGQLSAATNIDMNGFDVTFSGAGNFGIGVASPSAKFDVAGKFVVDTVNTRVGIGTTTPLAALDIAGSTSTITNTSGDININATSGYVNFSGNSLNNFLHATVSGQLQLGKYTTAGQPTALNVLGTGTIIYNTTVNNPRYWDGSTWKDISNFFQRDPAGIISPLVWYDSINIGGAASSSALIRLSTNNAFNTFFKNPVAIGFTSAITTSSVGLQVEGDVLPRTDLISSLGRAAYAWNNLFLAGGINNSAGGQVISINDSRLTGSSNWNVTTGLRVGDTSNTLPSGVKLYVAGDATISGNMKAFGDGFFTGTLGTGGTVTVGGGTGKMDVGVVDPPYTINGEKYATYMASMIGVKEEVLGHVSVSDYISGVGYRALIDLDQQEKGSDLWLFSKTTNMHENISNLSVLLTAAGQGKTWYEIDTQNRILAVYSSTPAEVNYRLTAPRFDSANWKNTRTTNHVGFVINDSDNFQNTEGTGLLNPSIIAPELIAQIDGTYKLNVNGIENKEVSSFAESIIANFKAGVGTINELLADNLTVRTKLVSPIADIDSLKVINATVSGTLYADNIKGKTIDRLDSQLDLLNEKYATASAILADLQSKYTTYASILGNTSTATISGDPLALSPLATTSATLPSDLALDSMNIHTVIANDVMANGSVFTKSISSFDTDLYIQPTADKSVHLLANLMTLYPDGKVVVTGDLLVTGTIYANNIDTRTATVSGTLALGKGELASDSGKLIALFNNDGKVVGSVDASGSANFGQITTDGLIIASGNNNPSATASASTNSNTTIGTATIATGSSEVVVANTKVNDNTLVYITPISNTDNQVLYVKSKQSGVGFTVAVPTTPSKVKSEISFNYWIIQTR